MILMSGEENPDIGGITFDSREVKQGDLFIAVRGTRVDGHLFIDSALQSGATVVVC